ncbi:MAG: sugar phosphate isomerase/epimerase family protein [Bryobacteraceae bacterium]|nr:sugar phosphate isomerase/epimerase family protein [Bryobacteraceae bacterium]
MDRRSLLKLLPIALAPVRVFGAGKARLKSALCAYSYRDALKSGSMKYEDLVTLAVETGIDGLDLTVYWFPDTTDSFLLPLKRAAYRSGVELYSISVRSEMTRAAAELQEKEVTQLRAWVDVAAKLGAGHIRVFGGNVPNGSTEEQAASWVVEVLKRAAEYAGSRGVILGLENHGGITSRAERIIEIVKKVDSPWVAVNLDTGNFEKDVFRQIEMLLPYAANVQVKAEMKDESGKKVAQDWDRVVGTVAKSGYRGYLALEYEAEEDAKTATPRLLRKLKELTAKYSA